MTWKFWCQRARKSSGSALIKVKLITKTYIKILTSGPKRCLLGKDKKAPRVDPGRYEDGTKIKNNDSELQASRLKDHLKLGSKI